MNPDIQPSSPRKSNKLKWLALLVILLVVAGVIIALAAKGNNNSSNSSNQASQTGSQTTAANSFAPESMANVPYVATISSTNNGQKTDATMTSDGKGNISFVSSANGQSSTIIYTSDAYYLCSGSSTCIKYAKSQSSAAIADPSTYAYDKSRLDGLKSSAAYKGHQSCPVGGGTCDVWSASSSGVTSTLYINSGSKRIVKATTSSGTSTSEITYEYKNATVTVPTNFTTLPSVPASQ